MLGRTSVTESGLRDKLGTLPLKLSSSKVDILHRVIYMCTISSRPSLGVLHEAHVIRCVL